MSLLSDFGRISEFLHGLGDVVLDAHVPREASRLIAVGDREQVCGIGPYFRQVEGDCALHIPDVGEVSRESALIAFLILSLRQAHSLYRQLLLDLRLCFILFSLRRWTVRSRCLSLLRRFHWNGLALGVQGSVGSDLGGGLRLHVFVHLTRPIRAVRRAGLISLRIEDPNVLV